MKDLCLVPKEVKICKFCKCKLEYHKDIISYNDLGFCNIGCFLMNLDHRIAKLESKIK